MPILFNSNSPKSTKKSILSMPIVFKSVLILLANLLVEVFLRENKSNPIIFNLSLIIFLFLLSQLEVQTFREDLGIWKRIASIIVLTGSIYSVILIISEIKSLERK